MRNAGLACAWQIKDISYSQDLRNGDLSLRPERSVGKQSQGFCDYVAVGRNDAVTLLLRKSPNSKKSFQNHYQALTSARYITLIP